MKPSLRLLFVVAAAIVCGGQGMAADDGPKMVPAPDRGPDDGEGPYGRLIIRGATLIDGTGAPPIGPVDIVIENNRIIGNTASGMSSAWQRLGPRALAHNPATTLESIPPDRAMTAPRRLRRFLTWSLTICAREISA